MTRDDGFAIADTDTSEYSDPKVVALARRQRDAMRTHATVNLYDAVRLASWKAGRRLTLEESMPAWSLGPADELAADLIAVGLLDEERRIPAHAWRGWFGPAHQRRELRRIEGQVGGLMGRLHLSRAEAEAEIARRSKEAELEPASSPTQAGLEQAPDPSNRQSCKQTVPSPREGSGAQLKSDLSAGDDLEGSPPTNSQSLWDKTPGLDPKHFPKTRLDS
jgi:hypothetical protein